MDVLKQYLTDEVAYFLYTGKYTRVEIVKASLTVSSSNLHPNKSQCLSIWCLKPKL